MTIRSIIYSNDRRPRLVRHGLFWMAYALYFALQSFFPTDEVRANTGYFVYVALFSTAMYFPYCFLSAYLLLYYLYPRYLRWGRHLAFAARFLALFLAGLVINYLAGIVFYRYTHWGDASFFNIVCLDVHNTIIAVIASVSILGLRLGREAWLQHEANLRLAAQKARAELQLLKTRIDPATLFRTLGQLRAEVAHKDPGAPAAILQLSEDLSGILYAQEGDLASSNDNFRYQPEALPVIGTPTSGIDGFIFTALFSPKPAIRLVRHLVFWLARFANLAFVYRVQIYTPSPSPVDWPSTMRATLTELGCEMLLSYGIAYGLFPLFFERRNYWRFAAGSLALLTVAFLITYPEQMNFHFPRHAAGVAYFWNALMQFVRTGFVTWLLFIAWRLNKQYFRRIRERIALSKEKADIEFQLLKAQVHPHFLFNTLNNIYSFALDGSPRAEELLAKLISIMNYMIYDCQAHRMPLHRELHLLEDYIGLEKARYGNRLDLQVNIQEDSRQRRIAPLLMIPFVENCFKHGASQVLEHPWVRLQIRTAGDQLDFRLTNNRPPETAALNGKGGIGLKNIRQRLDLLYPDRYRLEIDSADGVFSVRLIVPLEENIA
ncbi:MAG TPA: histidine kinase [Puia sp.]|uniref:sensor histidine kinase n=1 Tax=Puia sp. TaxID=2045100 RepID=UPI002BA4BA62|nr:histidine kinase [Puia sp.]HVU95385.1 histidine kinase [Puia sp.]